LSTGVIAIARWTLATIAADSGVRLGMIRVPSSFDIRRVLSKVVMVAVIVTLPVVEPCPAKQSFGDKESNDRLASIALTCRRAATSGGDDCREIRPFQTPDVVVIIIVSQANLSSEAT
jgi:hypothetical protein